MSGVVWDEPTNLLKQFEIWRAKIRTWFTLSQTGRLPNDLPTLDGLDYKKLDDALQAQIDRLSHAWPKVEWWPLYKAEPPQPEWYTVPKEIALEMQNARYAMVRVTRKDVSDPGLWEVYL